MKILKYIIALIGAAVLYAAFNNFTSTQAFLKNAEPVQGTVIELIRSRSDDTIMYTPLIAFETKSGMMVEFTSNTSSSSPAYYEGESIAVLYDMASPNDAKIDTFFGIWGVALIMGIIGFVFFAIGSLIIFASKIKGNTKKKLQKNGVAIKAAIERVEVNNMLEVNGRSPYNIVAQWLNPETTELHVFKSENIWFDPSEYIEEEEIGVLIEKNNPKKYYVDIAFLPKLAS